MRPRRWARAWANTRRGYAPHDPRRDPPAALRGDAGRQRPRRQGRRGGGPGDRARARDDALRRADPLARGGRSPLRARRLLRARDADRGARDAGRTGHPAPAARRHRRQAGRHVPHGHGQGRRARHRQEPLQHHARGRRLPRDRPRRQRPAGEVRRADQRARARRGRLLRVPDDDHADVQGEHQRAAEGRHPRQGDRHGRRRARHPGVRRRRRRRRLLGRRVERGQEGQAADRAEARRSGPGLMDTVLSSHSKSITIGATQPFCIIGERINPTGRKKLAEELKAGDLSTVIADVHAQVEAGATMLDVNAGIPLVDEAELLALLITTIQAETDLPLCLDSSVVEALEAALGVYQGKALVNSVTGEDERLDEILPLVARHGAAVIGLANDETGIPETPQQRLEIATKIVNAAGAHGIPPEDVVIDPLAMTVGADTEAVTTTLQTIRLLRDELGVNMSLGASNVSFGLPQRHVLNAAFLPMAMAAGLTSAIMSTAPVCVESVRATDLLLGHDPWGASWIAAHRARQKAEAEAATAS